MEGEAGPELTTSQKRWLDPAYRAYMMDLRRNKMKNNPAFRERCYLKKREWNARAKLKRQMLKDQERTLQRNTVDSNQQNVRGEDG